ncbi:hypothetical protein [Uliginosibacterium sp. TH139]|uniref:hypothetical protein n=1 Tax=Uliginosibacterium sp. TH139 TaxID=2067453 RepID=UPI000C7C58D1|nr:hypothetical protein [Uliginosibacterium sp. TH139]PLK46977.1 hypothetical protein C0V76_19155 [Uliginosibacterium sp. TH139]
MKANSLIIEPFVVGLRVLLMAIVAALAVHSVSAKASNSLDAQRAMAKAIYAADTETIAELVGQGFDLRGEILDSPRSAFALTLLKRGDLGPFLVISKALPQIEEDDLIDAVIYGGSLHALTLIQMRSDWPTAILERAVVLAFSAISDDSARIMLESVYRRATEGRELTYQFQRRPPDMTVIDALIKAGASAQSESYVDEAVVHGAPALVERFVYGSTVPVKGGKALTHALRRDDRPLADHLIKRGASILAIEVPFQSKDAYPDPEYILQILLRSPQQLLLLDPEHASLAKFRKQQPAPIKGRLSGAVSGAPFDFSLSFGKAPFFGNQVKVQSLVIEGFGSLTTPELDYTLNWNSGAGAAYEIQVEIPAVPIPDPSKPFPHHYYDVVLENITPSSVAPLKVREVPWKVSQNGLDDMDLRTGEREQINLANGSLIARAAFSDGWKNMAQTGLSITFPYRSHEELPKKFDTTTRLNHYLRLANLRYENFSPRSELVRNNNNTAIHLYSEQLYESGVVIHLDASLGELASEISSNDVILGRLLKFLIEFKQLDDYTIPDILLLSKQTPAELQNAIRKLNDQSTSASEILDLLKDDMVASYKRKLERFLALLMERAQYMDPDQNIDTLARQNIDALPNVDAARLHEHLALVSSLRLPAPEDMNGQGAHLLSYLNNK